MEKEVDTRPKLTKTSRHLFSFDIETTMRCKRAGFSSSTPWDTSNEVLLAGIWDGKHSYIYEGFIPNLWDNNDEVMEEGANKNIIVCGHNLKFDLLYAARYPEAFEQLMSCTLWDTSIAHYLLSCQQDKMPSLADALKIDELLIGEKDDLIKRLIAEGKTTEDVEQNDLMDYLRNDCIITYNLALAQMDKAKKCGMLKLIYTQCAALKAVVRMEHRGIEFDLEGSELVATHLEAKNSLLKAQMEVALNLDDLAPFINSNVFWSAVIFGGDYAYKKKKENGVWKSGKKKGQTKYTYEDDVLSFPCVIDPKDVGARRTKLGIWTVSDSILQKVEPTLDVIKFLRAYKTNEKLLSTYVRTLPTKLWGTTLHPNIHQTITSTGRYSQSNPNLQNQASSSEVKSLFIPRKGMAFIEADYKQLEMVAFAYDSKDPVLLSDLRNGVDVHDAIASEVFGDGYTKEQRRIVKGVNFGIIYGGGVPTLAEQSGISQGIVWDIVRKFYERYSSIKMYRARLAKNLEEQYRKFRLKDSEGNPICVHTSVTGRKYAIPLNKKVVAKGFSYEPAYTKMCNYPIQGLATGDIVPMMLGYTESRLREDNIKDLHMINTVHDSILFECPVDKVYEYARWVKNTLEEAAPLFERLFKTDFLDLPLVVDVQYSLVSWDGPWHKFMT
jgi:DNA polymerase I-like protein with 3'-5' exonuclease and polymerase domains